jgi:hypothetical protein
MNLKERIMRMVEGYVMLAKNEREILDFKQRVNDTLDIGIRGLRILKEERIKRG